MESTGLGEDPNVYSGSIPTRFVTFCLTGFLACGIGAFCFLKKFWGSSGVGVYESV